MSTTKELRRAMTAALRRLEAGGSANVEEARRLLREGLAIPDDDVLGTEYRG